MRSAVLVLLGLLLMAACGGESGTRGLDQPLWVTGAAFESGALPGRAPVDQPAPNDSGDKPKLTLTTIETNNNVVHPGQTGKRISGRATDDAYAVALRFEDLGDGYWVKPLGEADSAYPGELGFRVDLELASNLPLGKQRLLFSVIDRQGRAGRQQALAVCVTSPFDRALNACDDSQPPPAAVISLLWDSPADLDLIVRTPDGEIVDGRHPSTQTGEDAEDTDPAQQAILYADRGPSCLSSAGQREDLVWAQDVPPGRYSVFVNLFDACGEPASHFEVSAFARSQRDDETYRFRAAGEPVLGLLLSGQANGGREDGILITSVEFP
ncbi:MAG TPA: hypothetical protein VFG30_23330 [Polyangiales bacterium]|nr:hypothetical protein [Polyangiales bacterium]